MKSATRVTSLTRLTTAISVVAPIVVFGFLYVLLVQPQRGASLEARERLDAARAERSRLQVVARTPVNTATASRVDAFEAHATKGDRVAELVDGITAALRSSSAGGVTNLFITTGETGDGPIDSILGPLSRDVWHTAVTVTFDAPYEQIGRFFSNLRVLPATFDLRGVEITPPVASPAAGLMRAKVSLLVFHRPGMIARPEAPQTRSAEALNAPGRTGASLSKQLPSGAGRGRTHTFSEEPDPVVTGILVSDGRRTALVNGRLVRTGDRLPAGVVQSIELDAVVIAGPGGQIRRVQMARPGSGVEPR